ncbi:hypothetical protein TSUD_74760 [Trifolium subterraneum]|nr:hypothetical protein TSUD_74760 [Trifolium subterraneum]
MAELPCDPEGICMVCKQKPLETETLVCRTCVTPWHVPCLPLVRTTILDWECSDCSQPVDNINHVADVPAPPIAGDLVSAIRAIENDNSLTDEQKAKKRQELVGGSSKSTTETINRRSNGLLDLFDGSVNCSFCMQLPERPVTTPCGHNFCLKCFEKWINQGKRTCANCRAAIPAKMASNPRINSQLATGIRMAKLARSEGDGGSGVPKVYHTVDNDERPDTAFTTERAKKTGKSNACSGKIFVTVPKDHFGPISAENDPTRNRGVLVGDTWEDRMECRQWGAHFPHVAGIAGQSTSHKEKRSSYAPEAGVRYDGVYRIEKCWRKIGIQGHKVCRYLFVRCDNEAAPWTSDLSGDRPRPLPIIDEFKDAIDVTERKGEPSWDFDEEKGCWLWKKPPPLSKKPVNVVNPIDGSKIKVVRPKAKKVSFKIKDRLLKEFGCNICRKVLASPLTTPCAHNFCKACLEGVFSGQSFIRNRATQSGCSLRTRKNIMKCPTCSTDIADYLQNPQVNREMMGVIESLQRQAEQMEENSEESSAKSEESNDKSDENLKSDEEIEVPKPCGSSEIVLEEINENDLDPPQKRRKGADGKAVVNAGEYIDGAEAESNSVSFN